MDMDVSVLATGMASAYHWRPHAFIVPEQAAHAAGIQAPNVEQASLATVFQCRPHYDDANTAV